MVEQSLRVKVGRDIRKIRLSWWRKKRANSKKIVVGKGGQCQGAIEIEGRQKKRLSGEEPAGSTGPDERQEETGGAEISREGADRRIQARLRSDEGT
jgi:hypothetical protein